jgi:two-component system, OmpR family, sensor kinase
MAKGSRIFPSITTRLIIGLTLGTTLLWCAAAAYSTYVSRHELNEAFDRALEEAARRILPLAADDVLGHETDDGHAIQHFIEGSREYFSYQVRDSNGRIVLRAHDAPLEPFNGTPNPGFATQGRYRLFTNTDETTGLTITVAETTRGRQDAIIGAAKALLWPLVLLIPLNILIIWLAVRGAMRPMLRLSRDIAGRGASNLAPLDISDQPAELRPIAVAIARLMGRLRTALDAERAFAANSAHELRTPIAGALAQTQRLIAESSDPKDRRRARDMESTLKRLSALAEKLMQISRVDAGLSAGENELDLTPALDLVVSDCAKALDEPSRIRYVKPPGVKLVASMDMDAFAIAMRNLIDNAVNHGAREGQIDVQVTRGGVIRIINEGPIVPPDALRNLKERFVRWQSRSAGSGLGLAIVETISAQIGGNLELFSPAAGRTDGFEARLTLPSSQTPERASHDETSIERRTLSLRMK